MLNFMKMKVSNRQCGIKEQLFHILGRMVMWLALMDMVQKRMRPSSLLERLWKEMRSSYCSFNTCMT